MFYLYVFIGTWYYEQLLLFALKYAPKEYKLYLLPNKKGSSNMVPDYFLSCILCHSTLLFSPLVSCF